MASSLARCAPRPCQACHRGVPPCKSTGPGRTASGRPSPRPLESLALRHPSTPLLHTRQPRTHAPPRRRLLRLRCVAPVRPLCPRGSHMHGAAVMHEFTHTSPCFLRALADVCACEPVPLTIPPCGGCAVECGTLPPLLRATPQHWAARPDLRHGRGQRGSAAPLAASSRMRSHNQMGEAVQVL